MMKKNKQDNNEKKTCLHKILFIVLLVIIILLISFIAIDFSIFEHREKGSFNNIFDIKVKDDDNFVFLGDSITEYYPLKEYYENLPVVNSGIGGNTTDDILEDMENRVYKYNPTKVFLLVGINDMKKEKTEEEIFNNIVKIVDEIQKHRPKAKIYVESIYPINDSDDEKIDQSSLTNRSNDKIDTVNKKLEEKYKGSSVTYIDVNRELKEDNRLKLDYTVEGVHITPLGYIKVTRILLPYINE